MGKGAFEELQTQLGFHYAVGSILFNAYTRKLLDPTSHCIFDWMHVVFVGGVFNVLMGLLFHRFRKTRFSYANCHKYCSLWHWPESIDAKAALKQLDTERAKIHLDDQRFKCSASEGRTLLPVVAHYVRQGLLKSEDANEREHATCFLELASFVETLEASARGHVDAEVARGKASAFMLSFKRFLGGDERGEKGKMGNAGRRRVGGRR